MYIVFPENISLFPLISWFVLYLILQAFTHQNATESDSDTNSNCCTRNDTERLGKGAGKVKNRMTRRHRSLLFILGRVLDTWGDLVSLRLQWKAPNLHWCVKLEENNINDTWIYQRNENSVKPESPSNTNCRWGTENGLL